MVFFQPVIFFYHSPSSAPRLNCDFHNYWWRVRVTLVVGFCFCLKILGRLLGPTNPICHSVNVDGVVFLLKGCENI